ncbi:MAG: AAA family ATPase [Planctomycetaceae bacterium]|nr:AAA family ATPase [Planctomycetaceae bacterium]
MSNTYQIGGISLHLGSPDVTDGEWIGQQEVLKQLLACWLVVDPKDLPLTPRLVGTPGIGKTTLAIAGARHRNQELYIYQCTADTRPEDLLVTPVLAESGRIAYHASPLVTAMVRGGICVLDEGNRMNEKSWASLAPLLDHRRYVESIVAGVTIHAHPDFRCAVTMNEDESTFEIPDYILSRLQPTLTLGHPTRDDELLILRYHLPFADEQMLNLTVSFLQQAHELNLDFSTRDGINILRFALKRIAQNPDHPIARDDAWREALERCLGEEAVDLESLAERRNSSLGGNAVPMGLADFFFAPGDPLHPHAELEEEFDDDDDDDDIDGYGGFDEDGEAEDSDDPPASPDDLPF